MGSLQKNMTECNLWVEELRSLREEFSRMKRQLLQAAGYIIDKDDLIEVGHIHNVIEIQLVNIHDLKKQIKIYEKGLQHLDETAYLKLQQEHQHLKTMLSGFKSEFNQFLQPYSA